MTDQAVRRADLRAAFVAMLILVAPLIGGCSADHELCALGQQYLDQTKLQLSSDTYARAELANEGRCGREGLDRVSALRSSAMVNTAQGRAAEEAGDTAAARSDYRQALRIDSGLAAAEEGLARLAHPTDSLDPVWLPAQRLHDQSQNAAARSAVAEVLRAHPQLVIPLPLSDLNVDGGTYPATNVTVVRKTGLPTRDVLGLLALLTLLGLVAVMILLRSIRREREQAEAEQNSLALELTKVMTQIGQVRQLMAEGRLRHDSQASTFAQQLDEVEHRATGAATAQSRTDSLVTGLGRRVDAHEATLERIDASQFEQADLQESLLEAVQAMSAEHTATTIEQYTPFDHGLADPSEGTST